MAEPQSAVTLCRCSCKRESDNKPGALLMFPLSLRQSGLVQHDLRDNQEGNAQGAQRVLSHIESIGWSKPSKLCELRLCTVQARRKQAWGAHRRTATI